MTKPVRPKPFFVADDRALDFLNSVGEPWGTRIEWLIDGTDLLDWLIQADLLPIKDADRLLQQVTPQALDKVAAQARDLREWFREFVASHAGQRLEASAIVNVGNLNRMIANDNAYRQIEPWTANVRDADKAGQNAHNSSLQWRQYRRWLKPENLLQPIAQAMGELICEVNFERVKNCESSTCPLWFHDISKNHTRRWCTMAVCGNRAKAAAHRARMLS